MVKRRWALAALSALLMLAAVAAAWAFAPQVNAEDAADGTRCDEVVVYDLYDVAGTFGPASYYGDWDDSTRIIGTFDDTHNVAFRVKLTRVSSRDHVYAGFEFLNKNTNGYVTGYGYGVEIDWGVKLFYNSDPEKDSEDYKTLAASSGRSIAESAVVEFGSAKYYEQEEWVGNYVYVKIDDEEVLHWIDKTAHFKDKGNNLVADARIGLFMNGMKFESLYDVDEAVVYDYADLTGKAEGNHATDGRFYAQLPSSVNAAFRTIIQPGGKDHYYWSFAICQKDEGGWISGGGYFVFADWTIYLGENIPDPPSGPLESNVAAYAVDSLFIDSFLASYRNQQPFEFEMGCRKVNENGVWTANYVYVLVDGVEVLSYVDRSDDYQSKGKWVMLSEYMLNYADQITYRTADDTIYTDAEAVEAQISALPAAEELGVSDRAAAESAREAYEELRPASQKLVENLDVLTQAEDVLDLLEVPFLMAKGASMRLADPAGLRFTAFFDAAGLEEQTADGWELQFGVLIAPADYVAKKGALRLDNANYAEGEYLNLFAADKEWASADLAEGEYESVPAGEYIRIQGAIVEIKEQNYTRDFVGAAYMTAKKGDLVITAYAAENDNARSVYEVAAKALADETAEYGEESLAYMQSVVEAVNGRFAFAVSGETVSFAVKGENTLETVFVPKVYFDGETVKEVNALSAAAFADAASRNVCFGANILSVAEGCFTKAVNVRFTGSDEQWAALTAPVSAEVKEFVTLA